jgi:hypothetical protein
MLKIKYNLGEIVFYKDTDNVLKLVKVAKIKISDEEKVIYGVRFFDKNKGVDTKSKIIYVVEESLYAFSEI